MKVEELLDLTLREVLENYSALISLECGYYYGISSNEDIDEIFEEYNITEDDTPSFSAELLINEELMLGHENLIDYNKLKIIMDNLGIELKENKKG